MNWFVIERSDGSLVGPTESDKRAEKLAEEMGGGAKVRLLTSLSDHRLAEKIAAMDPEELAKLVGSKPRVKQSAKS